MSEEVYNDLVKKTDEELKIQLTALVKAKFNPPYFDEPIRKSIDAEITSICKEQKKRRS